MIEWSWRIEAPRSIRAGSWSGDRKMNNEIEGLQGRSVIEIAIEGRLPELIVHLSGGRWLRSAMTAEGQPAWVVFLDDDTWLCVQRGCVIHETDD